MNCLHSTKYKVGDFDHEEYDVILGKNDVEYYNKMFNEDYDFFFIKEIEEDKAQIYGSFSLSTYSNAYYLGEI